MALNTPSQTEVVIAGFDGQSHVCQPMRKETTHSFSAFVCFLSLGPGRTLPQVASKLGRTVRSVQLLSQRYDWMKRVDAWNQKLLQVQESKAEIVAAESAVEWATRQRQLRDREWEISQKALDLVKRMIDKLLKQRRGKFSVQDASRLLEVASKVGRLATGLATDREEVSGVGGGPIQVELSAALQKVYGTPLGRMDVQDGSDAAPLNLTAKALPSCTDSEPRNVPPDDGAGDVPESGTSENDRT